MPAGVDSERNRILPVGRCACHEPTVKWCGRHGQPLKLVKGERCMMESELWLLRECLDPAKAQQFATRIRAIESGKA
jgi:hypothetical protein